MAVATLNTQDVRYEQELKEALAPARGVVIGLVFSAVLWVPIVFLVMHL